MNIQAVPRGFDRAWSPPDDDHPKLGKMDRIKASPTRRSRTRIFPNWLPSGADGNPPHLPSYAGFVQLGVTEFELEHQSQGTLRFRVAVYQNLRFREALERAKVELDRNGSHPACEFILLPPLGHDGKFQMGTLDGRPVQIVQPYLIQRTQLVQAVYEDVMGTNPAHFKAPLRPVESVSWNDATEFCRRVGLRLPSEAQWEFACRAGSQADFTFGSDAVDLPKYAWFSDNAGGETHPVAELAANAFGLHDMHGNVWEWCRDPYHAVEDAPDDGRAFGEAQAGDAEAYRQQPHQQPNEDHAPHIDGQPGDEQRPDPMTAPARPTASTGAAAGSAARPTAGLRSATGTRPASATTTSASEPSEDEQSADPTPILARPSAPSETAAGSTTRPTAGARDATGTGPSSATAISASDAPLEGEQGSDPMTPATTAPEAGAGEPFRGTLLTAPLHPASGSSAATSTATSASAPSEGEERPDPTAAATPTGSSGEAATTTGTDSSLVARLARLVAQELTPPTSGHYSGAAASEGEQRIPPPLQWSAGATLSRPSSDHQTPSGDTRSGESPSDTTNSSAASPPAESDSGPSEDEQRPHPTGLTPGLSGAESGAATRRISAPQPASISGSASDSSTALDSGARMEEGPDPFLLWLLRGGSYFAAVNRLDGRDSAESGMRWWDLGFRCVGPATQDA